MNIIEKGTAPHSYKLNLFGLKIRFRNIFAFQNNKVVIIDKKGRETNKIPKGLKIQFLGANSIVKIYSPCPKFKNTRIVCGDNAEVVFGESNTKINNLFIHLISDGGKVIIGKNVKFRGSGYISVKENKNLTVKIGDNCLFADGVQLWTTDFHTVMDKDTKKALNPPASISIGNHCWICTGVIITKGVSLPEDTIAAARSVVTKSFQKTNTIIGGVPAKIIKDQNTTWTETPYNQYVNLN